MRSAHGTGVVMVLVASLLWGTTGTAAALAADVPALTMGAASMGIGGLLQAAIAIGPLRREARAFLQRWPIVLMSALAVTVYPLAFYSSMRLSGVAVGTVVTIGSSPPFAALVERVVDRSRLTRRWMLGTALGLAGVLVLALARSSDAPGAPARSQGDYVLGIALGLVGGCTHALYSWGIARLIQGGVSVRASTGSIFGVGGVLLIPILLSTGAPLFGSAHNMTIAAYLVVVPMFLGYVFYSRGLARISASMATTISLAEPAPAALIAFIVLHERLSLLAWGGLIILFASLVLTSIPPKPTEVVAEQTASDE